MFILKVIVLVLVVVVCFLIVVVGKLLKTNAYLYNRVKRVHFLRRLDLHGK